MLRGRRFPLPSTTSVLVAVALVASPVIAHAKERAELSARAVRMQAIAATERGASDVASRGRPNRIMLGVGIGSMVVGAALAGVGAFLVNRDSGKDGVCREKERGSPECTDRGVKPVVGAAVVLATGVVLVVEGATVTGLAFKYREGGGVAMIGGRF